jgi:site-specific DNA-methyltransferase (adenine-specific)
VTRPWDLRLGRWQDVLADVTECDAVITDPPYGERTHSGQRHGRCGARYNDHDVSTKGLGYVHLTPRDVRELCAEWSSRCRGWACFFTSHDLVPHYIHALERAGRYVFAPIACVQPGMNVRLAGDGPSNWTTYLVVSRPRTGPIVRWGTLPGAYVVSPGCGVDRAKLIPGSKPLRLMQMIVRDYTRPGDLVVDPYAGSFTTGLACAIEGRRCIGAEQDPKTFELAMRRISAGFTPDMFQGK